MSGSIEIHESAVIDPNTVLRARDPSSRIIVHEGCHIRGKWDLTQPNQKLEFGAGTKINGLPAGVLAEPGDELTFGEGCLLASPFFRTSDGHGIYSVETGKRLNPSMSISIGPRNWIGDRALILRGVVTSSDTVIGADSVVSRMAGGYPPNIILSGVPATIAAVGICWRHYAKDCLMDDDPPAK